MGTNVDGELVFACDRSGPVIHRTPEELGIPRTVVSGQLTVEKRTDAAKALKPRGGKHREPSGNVVYEGFAGLPEWGSCVADGEACALCAG